MRTPQVCVDASSLGNRPLMSDTGHYPPETLIQAVTTVRGVSLVPLHRNLVPSTASSLVNREAFIVLRNGRYVAYRRLNGSFTVLDSRSEVDPYYITDEDMAGILNDASAGGGNCDGGAGTRYPFLSL